jgi:hypothetical protein
MTTPENGRVPLEQLRIANPCPARWEEMEGDDRVRFCGACKKNVYNLSALQRSEAEALVASREGKMCATFFRRADGTVLTADCPVGQRKARVRLLRRVMMAAATFLGLLGSQYLTDRLKESTLTGDLVETSQQIPEAESEPELYLTPEEEENIKMLKSLGYIVPAKVSTDQTPPSEP